MKIALLIAMLAGLVGCGLLAHGTKQKILCSTVPEGALVEMSNGAACITPCTVTLSRKKDDTLTIQRDGYETTTLSVRSVLSGTTAGNILMPAGIVCWGIDMASGGAFKLEPDKVNVILTPASPQP